MKVLDFRRVQRPDGAWYEFRFGGGSDFATALAGLKAAVPVADRSYAPENRHLWAVRVATAEQPAVRAILAEIFENWTAVVEQVSRQMLLPGFE